MWRLLHWAFGWDYVHWQNLSNCGIARVHVDGEGIPYIWRYYPCRFLSRLEGGDVQRVVWLTCEPDKYVPPSLPEHSRLLQTSAPKLELSVLSPRDLEYAVAYMHDAMIWLLRHDEQTAAEKLDYATARLHMDLVCSEEQAECHDDNHEQEACDNQVLGGSGQ